MSPAQEVGLFFPTPAQVSGGKGRPIGPEEQLED